MARIVGEAREAKGLGGIKLGIWLNSTGLTQKLLLCLICVTAPEPRTPREEKIENNTDEVRI
jgi:hypothetical protein